MFLILFCFFCKRICKQMRMLSMKEDFPFAVRLLPIKFVRQSYQICGSREKKNKSREKEASGVLQSAVCGMKSMLFE